MMYSSNEPILLVEDDSNDVLLFQRAFRRAQISNPIHIVTDGDQAVHYLGGIDQYQDRTRYPLPLLVLLDLKLPRRSGIEVLEWVRQQPNLRRLPVVILTSSRESTDINLAYEKGANSYLLKPPSFDDLQSLLQTFHFYWLTLNQLPFVEIE